MGKKAISFSCDKKFLSMVQKLINDGRMTWLKRLRKSFPLDGSVRVNSSASLSNFCGHGRPDNMEPSSYNLIAPVKNEEEHLAELARCVINQSLLPRVWVIIDDGSTDRTPEIIKELTTRHTWIHSIRIEEDNKRTFGKHFANLIRIGFDKSLELVDGVKYLAKVDADARFHNETFAQLTEAMGKKTDLAVASPRMITLRDKIDLSLLKEPESILTNHKLVIRADRKRVNEPIDGIRIYRKEFLEEIGGYPITDASDDIILAKAVMKGYTVGFIDELWGCLMRATDTSMDNMYERGKFLGYRFYIEHYHPMMVLARLISDVFFYPSRLAGEFVGYFESLINRKERIDDPDVIRYYRKERFKKILEYLKEAFIVQC